MSIRAGELKECAEVDLDWSDAGPGPYTVRVVDSAALAANVGAAFKVWQALDTTSVKWEVDLSRDVPISIVVKPQQAPAKIYDIGTVQPGTCPPGTVLRGSKGSQSTMPNPEPTREPEPEPEPAPNTATQTPQPDPATSISQAPPNPASSAHDEFPQFSSATRDETVRRPSDDGPTRASTQTGDDFPTSVTTEAFPSVSGTGSDATERTVIRSTADTRGSAVTSASDGYTGSSDQQNDSETNHRSMGPVVGGVAGGIGAALLLGLLACYYLRRRRIRRRDELENREYQQFTDVDSTISHRRSSRTRTRKSGSGSQRSQRRLQEDRDAYDEKYGYMEELGPTPRQSRYSDGLTTVQLNEMRGAAGVGETGQGLRAPSLIHVDTESVRSMGVRHIIDPKELGRSPSSPKEGDETSVSARGSILSAFGGSGVGSNANQAGEKRGKWRSSLSAFATSPIVSSFFGGKGVVPTPPPKGADWRNDKPHEERFETLEDDERQDGYDAGGSVDSSHSGMSNKESDAVDQRFTLTLPTAPERIMPTAMVEQQARSDQTHHTGTTSRTNTLKSASRKSTATVKSTKTGRSATTFGPEKAELREKERGRVRDADGRSDDRSRERSSSGSSSRRQSRTTSTGAHSPSSRKFEVPPLPAKRKSTAGAPSSNDHRSSVSSKSVRSVTSRASKHVSGLAGLPALQYVDYGDDDDIPSVPVLPPMPFDDFGATPQLATTPTPSLFPTPPARPRPTVNTDVSGGPPAATSSPLRQSPQSTRRASRSILSPLSQSRSRANSDATTTLTHEDGGDEQSDNSCVTITARRVPVSAVGRVRSGMFERPRTLLMGTTSTTASMFSQGSSVDESGRHAGLPDDQPSPEHDGAYDQPAMARHSGLPYLVAHVAPAGGSGNDSVPGAEVRGPRFSERWSGWSPSLSGGSETRSGDGHAV